jgi:hypothetical protein
VRDVHCSIQIRPLDREGALHEEARKCQAKKNIKSDHGPQTAAQHQDELACHVPGRNKYRNLALKAVGVSKLRQQNIVMSTVGLRPEKDCAVEVQQQL